MHKTIYGPIVFILLVVLFAGCNSLSNEEEIAPQQSAAYLQVTRLQGSDESLNEDAIDYEDRVHDIALLIFDTLTGEKIGENYVEGIGANNTDFAFTVKTTSGIRDLYFVANAREKHAGLKEIGNRDDMNRFMAQLSVLDASADGANAGLYHGATISKGFPMSRVYLAQAIGGGGSLFSPIPFKPVVGGVAEEAVKLIRVVAKLQVRLVGEELDVKQIRFRNPNLKYSLKYPADVESPRTYYEGSAAHNLLKQIPGGAGFTTYVYYMPESIISSATWKEGGTFEENKPINYFTIETTGGKEYDIPIITHNDGNGNPLDITDGTYIDKAKGTEAGYRPDYSIYRNRNYFFTIKNLQKIEINYEIDPWSKVNKSVYMGYGYYVEVDDKGKVLITNTLDVCSPHEVRLVALGGAYFGVNSSDKEKIFDDHNPGVSSDPYTLSNLPVSGNYLQVYYNGEPVHVFKK